MSDRRASHHTVVVRRRYNATVTRVFAAWEDFGGVKHFQFGSPEQTFFENCRYEDIVPDERLCYAMTISRGDVRITTSMVTVEFLALSDRTELIVTDQLVILDGGDTAGDREQGWGETLDKLAPFLRSQRQR